MSTVGKREKAERLEKTGRFERRTKMERTRGNGEGGADGRRRWSPMRVAASDDLDEDEDEDHMGATRNDSDGTDGVKDGEVVAGDGERVGNAEARRDDGAAWRIVRSGDGTRWWMRYDGRSGWRETGDNSRRFTTDRRRGDCG
jgi:hypothetical protein